MSDLEIMMYTFITIAAVGSYWFARTGRDTGV